MVTIAVDAMGGDHAPKSEVEGAIRAVRTLGLKVILVGREDILKKELDQHPGARDLPIEIRHASERITMEDSAANGPSAPSAIVPSALPRAWSVKAWRKALVPPATPAPSWPPPRWSRA